jgi:hybrid cluster-associated redox disulfide protein
MTEEKITENMIIKDVIEKYPETFPVFAKYNIGCVGCAAASFESLKDIALVHGTDVKALVKDLNSVIQKKA